MSGFGQSRRTPNAFNSNEPSTGALQLLVRALEQVGNNAVTVGNNAGTSIAADKLLAMTPEQRADKNISDKFGGLALTDEFRKKLAQNEADAVDAEAQQKANEFITSTNAIKNQYDIDGDARAFGYASKLASQSAGNQMSRLKERLKGESSTGTTAVSQGDKTFDEGVMSELDAAIASHQTAIAAQDTQDGVSLEQKATSIAQMQKMKYDLLRKNGVNEVTARSMSLSTSPEMKLLMKQVTENNKNNLNKK